MNANDVRLLVYSTLFPHPGQPHAGVFIRERMFRVGRILPLVVVSPRPWFPLQGLVRRWRPHFRPPAPREEIQDGFKIYYPRFFSIPGLLKSWDGIFMALGSLTLMRRLRREFSYNLIDAHFAFPDGDAATLLGRWLDVPVTITLRGTEVPHARDPQRRRRMLGALRQTAHIFSVADALKRHVMGLGVPADQVTVVGNGVDTEKFHPLPRDQAREALDLPSAAPILISVGGLVERKGFHRVIECLPRLRAYFPGLQYLVVGAAGAEGDYGAMLRRQVAELGLEESVRFLGALPSAQLKTPLSAADVFVLATRNEGWANVFLEAMACGLPVVTTDVGGNREVVCNETLGLVVPFGDTEALEQALKNALQRTWDRTHIRNHACTQSWTDRVTTLINTFRRVVHHRAPSR